MRKITLAAAAAFAVLSTAAMATVTFDPATGTGFVGKGDVQTAFGWNNAAAQNNAKAVTFSYRLQNKYDVTCEWETVTGGPHSKTIVHDVTTKKVTNVNDTVAYDARQMKQYTGYILSGFGSQTSTGTEPVLGGSCPNGGDGVIVDVVQTESSGGFFVTYNGVSVQLQ
jgi:hypothetical protein